MIKQINYVINCFQILNEIYDTLTSIYPHRIWSIAYFVSYRRNNANQSLVDISDYLTYYPTNQLVDSNRGHVIIVRYRQELVAILGSDNTTAANDRMCQRNARNIIGIINRKTMLKCIIF